MCCPALRISVIEDSHCLHPPLKDIAHPCDYAFLFGQFKLHSLGDGIWIGARGASAAVHAAVERGDRGYPVAFVDDFGLLHVGDVFQFVIVIGFRRWFCHFGNQ